MMQTVDNRGIPFYPWIQGTHPGVLQKLLCGIHISLKTKGKL